MIKKFIENNFEPLIIGVSLIFVVVVYFSIMLKQQNDITKAKPILIDEKVYKCQVVLK
jgi:hypothetical protein